MIKRIARKLHIIILLHLGLVTFWFHFGKRKPSTSWFSDLAGVTMVPQTNILYHSETPKALQTNWEIPETSLKHIMLGNLDISEVLFLKLGKRREPDLFEDPFNTFTQILNMGSIWQLQLKDFTQFIFVPNQWRNLNIWNLSFQLGESPHAQHTDSHPCASPPLGRHEGSWGTREVRTRMWGSPAREAQFCWS